MNSKIYRCGYCGCPTNSIGNPLGKPQFDKVVKIIEAYGDGHTIKTHGACCPQEAMVQITRDMAIDAGDPSMEGEWVKW